MSVTASDWAKGIGYSVAASIIGGASKLAIRKSWLMAQQRKRNAVENAATVEINYLPQNKSLEQAQLPRNQCESPFRLMNNSSDDVNDDVDRKNPNNLSGISLQDSSVDNDTAEESGTGAVIAITIALDHVETKAHAALALRFSGMIGMTFLNPLFCVLAMNYASPSILAPFSGLTLVWIVLFSDSIIDEKPSKKQIIAACMIVLGEVIVAIFGDHTNDEGATIDDIVKSYQNPTFQLYFFLMMLWIASLAYIMIKRPSPTLKKFAWGVSGGSITGFQNFLKDSLTIMKACNASKESYPWYFYIFVLMAVTSSFTGLIFLTACMKRYDATFSSAMFVGSFVISASFMAAIHYSTFSHLESIWNWIMYPGGLLVLMIGVKMLVNATSENDFEYDRVSPSSRRQDSEGSLSSTEMRNPLVQSEGEGSGHKHTVV